MEVIQPTVVWIDDVVPVAVETLCVAMIGIDQHSGSRLCLPFPSTVQQKHQDASNEATIHNNSLIPKKKKAVSEVAPTHCPRRYPVSDLRRFVPVTLVDIDVEIRMTNILPLNICPNWI